jgi:hypothetical protein
MTEWEGQLLDCVRHQDNENVTWDRVIQELSSPAFDDPVESRYYSRWLLVVPDDIQKVWSRLSVESRIIAFCIASEAARLLDQ